MADMTIWKYPLLAKTEQIITIPQGARILTVQTQNGFPCLWAMVDQSKGKVRRVVYTYGTGHPISTEYCTMDYVGTFQLDNGGLVFHVFIGS